MKHVSIFHGLYFMLAPLLFFKQQARESDHGHLPTYLSKDPIELGIRSLILTVATEALHCWLLLTSPATSYATLSLVLCPCDTLVSFQCLRYAAS